MADLEFRRIADPEREPPVSWRELRNAALVLFLITVVAIAIVRAANLADDVAATRAHIETIQPCRPSPAKE